MFWRSRKVADSTGELRLIVGLGNPGPKYAATRHNIGHLVVELLAARAGVSLKRHSRTNALVAEARLPIPGQPVGERVVLVQALTFMNVTGGPVAALASYYRVAPEAIIAIHDDVDLPFDTVRLKEGGGEGGHNGLRDLTRALGTCDYLRVRMGVGRPPGRQDTADFVLSRFSAAELPVLPSFINDGADATCLLVESGLLVARQKYHQPVRNVPDNV